MKQLSQVLSDTLSSAEEKNSATSPTHPRGLTQGGGMMNPAQTAIDKTATPQQIDQSLKELLRSQPNLYVTYRKISVTDSDAGFLRTRDIPQIQTNSVENIKEIHRNLVAACRPCPRDQIVKELTGMYVGMARRKEQETDQRALLLVYAGDLMEYPEDIVRDACKSMRRSLKFFPTISEMREECEKRYEFRRALKVEIENLMNGQKKLAKPDSRIGKHWKELLQKDWLPQHFDWAISEAEDMLKKALEMPHMLDVQGWEGRIADLKAKKSVAHPV